MSLMNKRTIIAVIVYSLVAILALIVFVVLIAFSQRDRSVLLSAHKTYDHNQSERKYLIYSPRDEVEQIVIGLHGFGDTSRRFAYYTALHNSADSNTLVVYPEAAPGKDGTKKGWNAGYCCGSGFFGELDDSGFIIGLVEKLKQEHNAPDAKVFVTGFSNGAFMAQRLAAEHPEVIDGAAIASGSIGTEDKSLSPKQPVPILLMHGEKDKIVPFNGGPGSSDPDFVWLDFAQTQTTWESVNGSEATTKVITYENDKHQWHGWRLANFWHRKTDASQEAMNFFSNL